LVTERQIIAVLALAASVTSLAFAVYGVYVELIKPKQ
jgi:hypothetical protein